MLSKPFAVSCLFAYSPCFPNRKISIDVSAQVTCGGLLSSSGGASRVFFEAGPTSASTPSVPSSTPIMLPMLARFRAEATLSALCALLGRANSVSSPRFLFGPEEWLLRSELGCRPPTLLFGICDQLPWAVVVDAAWWWTGWHATDPPSPQAGLDAPAVAGAAAARAPSKACSPLSTLG